LAEEAEAEFESVFKKGNLPEDMPEHRLSSGTYRLSHLMVDTGTAKSRGEASRLIKQGAVEIGGERFKADTEMSLAQPGEVVLKVGKRRFVRLVVEG
jgi:tyrosyl-tRNA synthetase